MLYDVSCPFWNESSLIPSAGETGIPFLGIMDKKLQDLSLF
jgi:hypothetical protein